MDGFAVKWLIFCIISVSSSTGTNPSNPCNFVRIGDGVCICNATYCDSLDVPQPICNKYTLITSSKSGKRFEVTTAHLNSSKLTTSANRWLQIDGTRQYQKIIGFGGALTDSASLAIASMEKPIRDCVYKSYASATAGAAYQIIRIPLGGSDFSEQPWAYNEQPVDDVELTNMTEMHAYDRRRADQIKELQTLLPECELKLMLCTWSPPPWMKNNKRWEGASRLLSKYYSTWALYHTKALDMWRNEGMQVWSISTGNEPMLAGLVPFMSLGWNPRDQRRWLTNHLKPMLKQNGYSDVLILGVDEQRSALFTIATAFEQSWSNPQLVDVDMIGLHWYFDASTDPNLIDTALKRYQIPILYTESCEGAVLSMFDMVKGPILGSWKRCQQYVHKMMNNFKHGISAFIDWNMVLDERGGPNYVNNFADAPMIFYEYNQTLIKQPMFYGIAHFSKFLRPGCVRIDSKLSFISGFSVEALAFSCLNRTKVIVLHNRSSAPEPITITDNSVGQINITLDALSVNTLVYQSCEVQTEIDN